MKNVENLLKHTAASVEDALDTDLWRPIEALPRVLMKPPLIAYEPCHVSSILCMAGIEFIQQVIPRTPYRYNHQDRKAAAKADVWLQSYSAMEVRRIEKPQQSADDSNADHERHYHFSIFQRRH